MSRPDIAISVEGLSKRYLVGHQAAGRERYTALRDVIGREARNMARRVVDLARGRQIVEGDEVEEFWALKDVSFEVKRGEIIGIVGRNGAGKSTLLKILSRITEPTEGRAVLRGRIASLLEVGTGFHPELTGRENIFLNGAVLGMTRAEVRRNFDEIVAFAEVERFLDTPVKRYSSGMYVRLAFAVAAHLEPEILVVDEVLAVGDAAFQKKCLGKMRDVATRQGRTVLFVSHSMAAIENMCDQALLLAQGRCIARGETHTVVQDYLKTMTRVAASPLADREDRQGTGEARFASMALENTDGSPAAAFKCGSAGVLHAVIDNRSGGPLRNLRVAFVIDNAGGQRAALMDTWLVSADIAELPAGQTSLRAVMPRVVLAPGRYFVTIWSSVGETVVDWVKDAGAFDVEEGDFFGSGHLPPPGYGQFMLDHHFVVGDGAGHQVEWRKRKTSER
jgi:lipopolysaccharide transport system ATP-binding protein